MTGINQSMILTGTKGITARVTVEETYDIFANTSDVRVGLEIASNVYGGHLYYLLGSITADGQVLQSMSAYAGTHFVYLEKTGTYYPVAAGDSKHTGSPWSLSGIRHQEDGSKILTLDLRLTGEEENGSGADDWEIFQTVQVLLTQIPRASTVAATDAAVGAVSLVAVSRKNEDYTHSIRYQFGELSGYLSEEGTSAEEVMLRSTGIAFSVPESFYSQIPNAKTGLCRLFCKTYRDDDQIGQEQSCSFTVGTDPQACAPLVNAGVEDSNPSTLVLTGDKNVLVRYMSTALCTVTAQGRNGASIEEVRVDSVPVSANTYTLPGIERDVVVFTARDSRGYTAAVSVQKQLVPYVNLSCNPAVKRTDPTSGGAILEVTGDYYAGSFGAAANTLQLHYRVGEGDWVAVTPQTEGQRYSAQVALSGLDYTKSHTLQIRAADRLQTVSRTATVGKGIPVFDWGQQDFAFHVPVYLAGLPTRDEEAASKAYADGKLALLKLWENPDPGGAFPSQLVQMDLSGCAFLFCTALARSGGREYQTSAIIPNAMGNAGQLRWVCCDGTDLLLWGRKFSVNYQGILFDHAWQVDLASGTAERNLTDRSVPLAVYGLK